MTFKIKLSAIEDVKEFVNIMISFPFKAQIHSGVYIVDAKSLMGLFSLNLSEPVDLVIPEEEYDLSKIEDFKTAIDKYVVKS